MSTRFQVRDICLVLGIVALTFTSHRVVAKGNGIVDRFKIFNDGDALLVPVEVEGKAYLFLIETGSNKSAFDSTLIKGTSQGIERFTTATDKKRLELFSTPHAQLGSHQLENELDSVVAFDFANIREATGHEIYGVIGMNFLGKYVMRIDFDNGTVEFLTKLPELAKSDVIPLRIDEHGMPYVAGRVEGWNDTEFMLDTGCITFDTGHLESRTCEYLQRLGLLDALGSQDFLGAAGKGISAIFQAKSFTLCGYQTRNPILSQSNGDRLGLYYLSRFNVAFDFPNKKMYLSKSKAFEKPDGRNLSGMGIVCKEGKMLVGPVNADSPANKAGLREGDVLLSVGNLDATKARLFELAHAMAQPNPSVPVIAVREGKQIKVILNLK